MTSCHLALRDNAAQSQKLLCRNFFETERESCALNRTGRASFSLRIPSLARKQVDTCASVKRPNLGDALWITHITT